MILYKNVQLIRKFMKRILLNTKTYIGPLNKYSIDFYSIYRNQLYIVSEDKLKYILNYLKIQFPNKSKIGFNISKWLYKKNLLNENFLSEISSKILNVPKDFSENDVYYYLCSKEKRKDIYFLFLESLKNTYLYNVLKNKREDFISVFLDFLKTENRDKDISAIINDFSSYFLSDENHLFLREIKNMKFSSIMLKDKFFFERIGKFLDVVYSDGIYKQYFFPKRYNLEFILEDIQNIDLEMLLKNMAEINNKRFIFEQIIFKKRFAFYSDKVFKTCENANFSFIDFDTVIFLILFFNENTDIKIDKEICKILKKDELLNYFVKIKVSFIVTGVKLLEPCNYAKIKIFSS